MTISGYKLTQQLSESDNSLIYRGKRLVDNKPVILKILNQPYPSPENLAEFQQEYRILYQLNDLPGVINAYNFENQSNQEIMVLEDLGAMSLDLWERAVAGLPLNDFIGLAIKIATIVGQLHQHYVIHQNINPSNIVLNVFTHQVKLIDFGLSTLLLEPSFSPNLPEGTLPYRSPEQTGRVNRLVDYRTDFYSLGVTFYELLTGRLPFPMSKASDAEEMIFCHIVKSPEPPHLIQPDMMSAVSDIVLKLMAKDTDERYQSAYGLIADLKECQRQLESTGQIKLFPLRQSDVSARFEMSSNLYGRQTEIERLKVAMDRVSGGASEMILVAGYAGIGKTTLVAELYKPLIPQRCYFIAGKFDPLQRNLPYIAFTQAFRSLVFQLLTKREVSVTLIRDKLLKALGPNGQILIDMVPEIARLIGQQPTVPTLSPMATKNRFYLVFQNFIKVFTQPEHPLVIFLDDLQWADEASLTFIEWLMTTGHKYLLLIGTYRDYEVDKQHPLRQTLQQIKKAPASVNQITLSPLSVRYVTQLMIDTFHCAAKYLEPLAEWMYTKTNGNPFFLKAFLQSLYDKGVLTFDKRRGLWQWQIKEIQTPQITDNIAEWMAERLCNLSQETQAALEAAACFGKLFDLNGLALVVEKSPEETANLLEAAVSEGFLVPINNTTYQLIAQKPSEVYEKLTVSYQFAHDLFRQFVLDQVAPDVEELYWHVGQKLRQNTPLQEFEPRLLDIANLLNQGRAMIENQPIEREKLALLNLRAGKQAKIAAAYPAALKYLQVGLEMLEDNCWRGQYKLALELYVAAVEVAFLNGDYQQVHQLTAVVQQQAQTILDKIKVYEITLQTYFVQHKLAQAMQLGQQIMALLGMPLPDNPSQSEILQAYQEARAAWANKAIDELIHLPPMRRPNHKAAIRILENLSTTASISNPAVYQIILLRMVTLLLEHGNTSLSASTYVSYAILLCGAEDDINAGYQFGQLALKCLQQHQAKEIETRTIYGFNTFIRPWKEPLRDTLTAFLQTYQSGLETGDLAYAAGATFMYVFHSYWVGNNLTELEQEIAQYHDSLSQLKQESMQHFLELCQQPLLNLLGRTDEVCRFSGAGYDEPSMLAFYQDANDRLALCLFYLNKLALCYLFQQYPQAIENALQAEAYLDMAIGMQTVPLFHFYDSLAHLAVFPSASEVEQTRILERVTTSQAKMEMWAKHAPMNFQHKFLLVAAEQARVLGQFGDAREYYDQAIALAHQHQYLNEEALAYELAAQFYMNRGRGQSHFAHYYRHKAYQAYQQWGAIAKVQALEAQYPQPLLEPNSLVRDN